MYFSRELALAVGNCYGIRSCWLHLEPRYSVMYSQITAQAMKQTYEFNKYQGRVGWFLLESWSNHPIPIKQPKPAGSCPTLETGEATGGEDHRTLKKSLTSEFCDPSHPCKVGYTTCALGQQWPTQRWLLEAQKAQMASTVSKPSSKYCIVTHHCSYSKL